MEDHILVRYGELSLKKTNRRQFVTKVTNHIKRSLSEYKDLAFESRGMRFYVILNNTPSEPVIKRLQKIPGVYSFSVVSRTESKIDYIKFEIKEREAHRKSIAAKIKELKHVEAELLDYEAKRQELVVENMVVQQTYDSLFDNKLVLESNLKTLKASQNLYEKRASVEKELEKLEFVDIKPSMRKYPYVDFKPNREVITVSASFTQTPLRKI